MKFDSSELRIMAELIDEIKKILRNAKYDAEIDYSNISHEWKITIKFEDEFKEDDRQNI